MGSPQFVPVPLSYYRAVHERNRLFACSLKCLADEIKTIRFHCTCCGTGCTRVVNGHIFLLDHDVAEVRKIDPAAFEPIPNPEFCDQNGMFYVSGYALRMKNDDLGSCWFLENGKCRIYERSFSVCRIYPHMLRRNINEVGMVTWRKLARPNLHGHYHTDISDEECLALAREIKEYENAFFTHQISFLETIQEYFTLHQYGMTGRCMIIRCRDFSMTNLSISWYITPEIWKNTRL